MKQEAIALYRGNVQRTGEYQAVGVPDFHALPGSSRQVAPSISPPSWLMESSF